MRGQLQLPPPPPQPLPPPLLGASSKNTAPSGVMATRPPLLSGSKNATLGGCACGDEATGASAKMRFEAKTIRDLWAGIMRWHAMPALCIQGDAAAAGVKGRGEILWVGGGWRDL